MKKARGQPVDARVLIVIVNYRTADLTIACLRSIEGERAHCSSIRATVVDNDSGDGDALGAAIARNGWAQWVSLVRADRNGGFAYGNNLAIAPALKWERPPDYFLLLNPDTEVRSGAVRELVRYLDAHPEVGIAGSGIDNPDGSEWSIAFRFPTVWGEFEQGIRLGPVSRLLRNRIVARRMGHEPAQVDWVSGASMLIRRQLIEQIGLLDEGYFLYYEELDFCLRAHRAGWWCWYVPQSRVMHIHGQSTGMVESGLKLTRMPAYWFESRSRYFVKQHGLAYARLADLAYGIGLVLWNLRRVLTRRPRIDPPGMLVDFWRTSVLFKSAREVRQRLAGSTGH